MEHIAKPSTKLLLIIGIVVIILACLFRIFVLNKLATSKTITSSTLSKAIDIDELSTAEYKYRGIADVYTNESEPKISYKVCYNAIIKASIHMKDVQFDVDQTDRMVLASLPEIKISANIIDQEQMLVLPSNAKAEINDMLKYSESDAENEAMTSIELISTARDNAKSIIEGLLYSILHPNGYSLKWTNSI